MSGSPTEVAVFVLARRRFALELSRVEEVLRLGHVTIVPLSPTAILGAMHVRGQVLPVIDAALVLVGEASRPAMGETCLRVGFGAHHLLLYVGKVEEVARVGLGTAGEVQTERGPAELISIEHLVEKLEHQVAVQVGRLRPEPGSLTDASGARPGGER